MVFFFPTPGDDPPACDRGEDEPESISALQSTLCGRRDSGWNWWVVFSQKPLRRLGGGTACCNKNEVKWKQWWNSHLCQTDKASTSHFLWPSVNLLFLSGANLLLFVQMETQIKEEPGRQALSLSENQISKPEEKGLSFFSPQYDFVEGI